MISEILSIRPKSPPSSTAKDFALNDTTCSGSETSTLKPVDISIDICSSFNDLTPALLIAVIGNFSRFEIISCAFGVNSNIAGTTIFLPSTSIASA